MQEKYVIVQKGFRILVTSMSGYIGQEMNKVYKERWWDEVLFVLQDQRDLPMQGSYGELVDSLDVANCLRILERKWNDVFRNILPLNCRTWAKELMGVRNVVSHIGQQDLEQLMAERALDTLAFMAFRRSWPQDASMSLPSLRRTVAVIPRFSRAFWKAATFLAVLGL